MFLALHAFRPLSFSVESMVNENILHFYTPLSVQQVAEVFNTPGASFDLVSGYLKVTEQNTIEDDCISVSADSQSTGCRVSISTLALPRFSTVSNLCVNW